MKGDSLGDRMKENYENITRTFLTRRMPFIIRCDGRSFHSFTKGFQKPFDNILIESMWETAKYLCENVEGCKVAYVQSDEISLLLTDYDSLDTMPWFNKNIQKIVSVSASMATLAFNKSFNNIVWDYQNSGIDSKYENFTDINIEKQAETYKNRINTATFDSRVFNVPKEEICNYFIWRQQDATRNAIQMVGQANFSHKQLQGKSCNEIQEMLFQEKGLNFNDLSVYLKRGACVIKRNYMKENSKPLLAGSKIYFEGQIERTEWIIDKEIPIFTQDRNYIEKYV